MNNIMMVKKLFLVFLFLVVLSSFTSAVGGDFFINHVTGGDGLLVVDIGGLSFQGNGFVASTPPTLPTGGSSGAGADVDGPLFTKYFCNLSFGVEELFFTDDLTNNNFVLSNNMAFDLSNIVFDYDSDNLVDGDNLFTVRPGVRSLSSGASQDYVVGLSSFVDLPLNDEGFLLVSSDECYPMALQLSIDVTVIEALDLNIVQEAARSINDDLNIGSKTFKGYWLLIIFMILIGLFTYRLLLEGDFWNVCLYFFIVLVGGFLLFFITKNVINLLIR